VGGRLLLLFWDGRSKLGDLLRQRFQVMPQFQPQVPDPLGHHLPGELSPGRVAAPPIRILLGVFICQCRFEGAAMQVQLDHIAGGKCLLWQVGEEELRLRRPHA
jgi:hypothetical protein